MLGVKQNIDDFRNSHSIEIIELLLSEELNVIVSDPYLDSTTYTRLPSHIDKNVKKLDIKEAMKMVDTIIFSTAHDEYKKLNIKDIETIVKKDVKIIDLWNIFEGKLEKSKDIDYMGLGRGDLR